MNILQPVLALVIWTFVLWFLLYATRLPAMQKAKIKKVEGKPQEEWRTPLEA
ncbi:MAG: hypothetical protein H7318_15590 [Oligoflexus sp.]|nr:hypothetical protein [Oligoflexus sp.]